MKFNITVLKKCFYVKLNKIQNKLGLSLRTKKGLFWAKILINLEFKGQKLTKSQKKKKKDISGQKKQAGAELKNKKRSFLGKNSDKN